MRSFSKSSLSLIAYNIIKTFIQLALHGTEMVTFCSMSLFCIAPVEKLRAPIADIIPLSMGDEFASEFPQ